MIRRIMYLMKKELIMEYSRNKILLLAMTLSFIVSFVFCYAAEFSFSAIYGHIFWFSVFFAAFSGMNRIFRYETESGNLNFLVHYYSVPEIMISKFLFNSCLVLIVEWTVAAVCVFTGNHSVKIFLTLPVLSVLSSLAISSSTLFSALISSGSDGNYVFAISSLPVVLPLMLVLFQINIFSGEGTDVKTLVLIFLYTVFYLIITLKLSLYVFSEVQ